ncbi:MAG: arsenate reductase [Sphingomonadales bacterium]|jgi:arsenate reductase
MTEFKLYGIPNCDTVKKAKRWFEDKGLSYHFHDFRKDGLDEAMIAPWLNTVGVEKLINKRGTTWRKLEPEIQQLAESNPTQLMMEYPALIKRPVIEGPHGISVGFTAQEQASISDVI